MFLSRTAGALPLIALTLVAACSEPPAPAILSKAPSTPTGHYDIKRDPAIDVVAAVKEATAQQKRILLVVGGEWCSWCHILDAYLKSHPDIQTTWNDRFVTVFVNWSEENKNAAFLSAYPEIPGYPHIFVLDRTGAFLHSQDTALLEEERSYSKAKMQEFLDRWKLPAA